MLGAWANSWLNITLWIVNFVLFPKCFIFCDNKNINISTTSLNVIAKSFILNRCIYEKFGKINCVFQRHRSPCGVQDRFLIYDFCYCSLLTSPNCPGNNNRSCFRCSTLGLTVVVSYVFGNLSIRMRTIVSGIFRGNVFIWLRGNISTSYRLVVNIIYIRDIIIIPAYKKVSATPRIIFNQLIGNIFSSIRFADFLNFESADEICNGNSVNHCVSAKGNTRPRLSNQQNLLSIIAGSVCSLRYYCFGWGSVLGRDINGIRSFGSGKSAVCCHDNSLRNIDTTHDRHRKYSLSSMCEFKLHESDNKCILHYISHFFNKRDDRTPVRDGLGIWRFRRLSSLVLLPFFCPLNHR